MNQFYIGCGLLVIALLFFRNAIRIQWQSVASFCGFMCLVTALRFAAFEVSGAPSVHPYITFSGLSMVFWEDMFHAFPIWLARDYFKLSKWIWIPIAVGLSLMFASGHIYLGLTWAATTLIYPYFISYRLGKQYGFGTVMVCHILYDVATICAILLYKAMMMGRMFMP